MEDTLYSLFCEGVITKSQCQRNISKIRHDRRGYMDKHFEVEQLILGSVIEIADELLELATGLESKYKSWSGVEKRDFIKRVCSNQLLDGQTIQYQLKNPYRVFVAMKGSKEWLTLVDDFRCRGRSRRRRLLGRSDALVQQLLNTCTNSRS